MGIINSSFYSKKAKIYFQLFLEKFNIELTHHFFEMEQLYFKLKSNGINEKIANIEDIEDGLYMNAIFLSINHSINFEGNYYFIKNLLKDPNSTNIIENIDSEILNSLLPPKLKYSIENMFNEDFNISPDFKNDIYYKEQNDADDFFQSRAKSFNFVNDTSYFYANEKNDYSSIQFNCNYFTSEIDNHDFLTMACSSESQNNFLNFKNGMIISSDNKDNQEISNLNEEVLFCSNLVKMKHKTDSKTTAKRSIKKKAKIFEIRKIQKGNEMNEAIAIDQSKYFSFLRKFNPKSIKKEVIDKKIIRKFRKFLKNKIKLKKFNEYHPGFQFWKEFAFNNLVPPMLYINKEEKVEFKSFKKGYIVWLVSKVGAKDFFSKFLKEKKGSLIQYFKGKIRAEILGDIAVEFKNIENYVDYYCDIYYNKNLAIKPEIIPKHHEVEPEKNLNENNENMSISNYSNSDSSSYREKDLNIGDDILKLFKCESNIMEYNTDLNNSFDGSRFGEDYKY